MNKQILLLTVISLFAFSLFASNDNKPPTDANTTYLKIEEKNHRPNVPARYGLQCFYGEGFLQIEMPADAASMIVVVEQNGVIEYEGMITCGNTYMQLPVLSGCFTIRCETDTHQFFTGEITF